MQFTPFWVILSGMRKTALLAVIAAVLILCGCTVTQSVSLGRKGGGSTGVTLETTDFFKDLIVDLTSFTDIGEDDGRTPDTVLLDRSIGTLWANIQKSSASTSSYFWRTPERVYIGEISFSNLPALIADLGAKAGQSDIDSLFRLEDNSLTIRIAMENWHVLTELVPFLTEENFETYGPVYNHGQDEEEYLEMMDFILGDETSAQILGSRIILRITAPGCITSANGTLEGADTAVFSIPLIRLLLLNEDIELHLSWE